MLPSLLTCPAKEYLNSLFYSLYIYFLKLPHSFQGFNPTQILFLQLTWFPYLHMASRPCDNYLTLTVWITINCGKFFKRWEYQTTWPASWEAVRTGHGATNWFQRGKGERQGCIVSPCLFNLYAEYIMWNARLDEALAGIKVAGRNINNLR